MPDVKFKGWTSSELEYFTFAVAWCAKLREYLASPHGQLMGPNGMASWSYSTVPGVRRVVFVYRTPTSVVITMGATYEEGHILA